MKEHEGGTAVRPPAFDLEHASRKRLSVLETICTVNFVRGGYIAMADQSKVGKEYAPFVWEVERGKIRELVSAIGDPNPVYVDRTAAVAEGYRDTPAPPTFATLPFSWNKLIYKVAKDLKMNFARFLHGGEAYEYFGEIYPGDVLTGTMKILSIDEKKGGKRSMDIVNVVFEYRNQHDELVVRATTTAIERK